MDKKTSIVILIIGIVIIALIGLAFALETKTTQLSSNDILRINDEIYHADEFEKFIKYTLYKNNGEITIDEEEHANDLANGTSKEDIFLSDTLNSFYQMKVYGILAKEKNIVVTSEDISQIESDFDSDSEKITASGLSKEDFVNIEKQQAIISKVSSAPTDYLELPDGVYDEYIGQFSGDELKSYTYRIIQVGYTEDKVSGEVSGETSGEIIPGDKAEKEAYMNAIVARINAGESFEAVSESGDNRLIFKGNGIEFAKSIQEYAAGFLLEQKVGEEMYEAMKNTEAGKITDIIDSNSVFQIALVEKVEDGIVGESKDELIELMITEYASDLIYSYVKDMEVNNSALSRIKIK